MVERFAERGGTLGHVGLAIAAAVLYALRVPLSKLLMGRVEPGALAGLLYVGAAVGMWAILAMRRVAGRQSLSRPMAPRDTPYVVGMVVLDIAAPLLLMAGLATSAPVSVSLLNKFEIVATALFARLLLGETPGTGFVAALALMAPGSWLSLPER